MASHIYVLTDGSNTKIGIKGDLAKRIATYETHNPNYQVFKTYECEDGETKRIEAVVKTQYLRTRLSDRVRNCSKSIQTMSSDTF